MHESTLALSILGIVVDEAAKAHAAAVRSVTLCVGELACVEPQTLTACFELVAEGTLADKTRLSIRRIPATGTCEVCGAAVRRQNRLMRCPKCSAASIKLVTGRELYVESIEVDQSPEDGHGNRI
jgi:hydrogenase nickel incorporation protein HypA/HybF